MATHRVRIAVLIDEHGSWKCFGYGMRGQNGDDKVMVSTAWDFADDLSGATAVHFVEADVRIPLPETVTGSVDGSPEGA